MKENLTLLTDFYQLTMMQGYFENNSTDLVIFDAFYRKNPCGNGYAIAAGLEQVIDYMCHKPARLYAIEERGYIAPHYTADLVVVKPVEGYEVKDADVLSRCGWTPLVGETLHHRVVATYVNGQCAYRDGVVNNAVRGEALKFRN